MQLVLQPPFNQRWMNGYLQTHESGRRYVCLYNSQDDRTIISYARYLMCVKIGQMIPEGYEVDHRDDDYTNDDINNLQIVTKEYNLLKEHYRYIMFEQEHIGLVCACCETPYLLTERQWKQKMKESKSGLAFCSHECSIIYNSLDPLKIYEIRVLKSQGLSSYKIAEKTGLSRFTVQKYW